MHMLTRKRALGAFATLAVLAVAGVAFAYFTTTGEGNGEATVGTDTALTIHGTISESLYPGTKAKVKFTVDNTGKGTEYVGTIKLKEVKAFKDAAHKEPEASCVGTWFTMPDVTEKEEVAGKASGAALATEGELEFKNEKLDQSACKNAYLVATFESA